VKNLIPRNRVCQLSKTIEVEGTIFAISFSKKYDISLLSIECRVLDRCRAFDRLACVDAHPRPGVYTIYARVSCGVFKLHGQIVLLHFRQLVRFPLFTDFASFVYASGILIFPGSTSGIKHPWGILGIRQIAFDFQDAPHREDPGCTPVKPGVHPEEMA
jgi:hypothetical protein